MHEIDNSKPKPSPQLLLELNKHLEVTGQYNPLEKVYIKMGKNSNEFLTFVVIFVLTHINKLAFGKNLLKYNKANGSYGPAIARQRKLLIELISSNRFIDGHVFLLGLITLLRQFYENNYMIEFVEALGACVFEMMEYNLR
jgi:WASH complex subunit strumpellin